MRQFQQDMTQNIIGKGNSEGSRLFPRVITGKMLKYILFSRTHRPISTKLVTKEYIIASQGLSVRYATWIFARLFIPRKRFSCERCGPSTSCLLNRLKTISLFFYLCYIIQNRYCINQNTHFHIKAGRLSISSWKKVLCTILIFIYTCST